MKFDNVKYQNQMISVDASLLAIKDYKLCVLLLKRSQEPYKDMWSLIGGGVYNNETCENAVKRELKEKLDITGIAPILGGVFSEPKRDIRFRNISISYYCLVNADNLHFEENSDKVEEVKWFYVDNLPKLAFDHGIILQKSLDLVKEKAFDMDFIKNYIPTPFSLARLQEIYESILGTELDKRNFRRKITSLNCLKATGLKSETDLRKKSALYTFK